MIGATTDLRAGFIERVGIAFVMALGVGIPLTSLKFVFGYYDALVLACSVAATVYAVWLVFRSNERRAMLLAAIGWAGSLAVLLVLMLPAMLHVAALFGMVWVMRALYVYRTPVAALLDAGLVFFAGMAGFWALMQTGSPAIATWTAFLLLAVLVQVPTSARSGSETTTASASSSSSQRFERAQAAAEQAVSNLRQA